MARSKHSQPGSKIVRPRSRDLASRGISQKLVLVWAFLAAYLLLFFLSPLASTPASQPEKMPRGQLWQTLLLGDDILRNWIAGCSWATLTQRGLILAVAGAILVVALAAGWICLRLAGIDRHLTRLELAVFSAGVGLNLVSLVTLALGLCGIMRADVFISLGGVVLTVANFLFWRATFSESRAENDVSASLPKQGEKASLLQLDRRWLWLALPFVLAIFGSAMLPPADFDVREYHLQAPKEFYQAGRIAFLPHNIYANMPLGTEMLSLLGMVLLGDWWTGALVGKTLIACYAPLTALALLAAGRRFVSPSAGIVAALVYISIPWVALVSTQGLVEGGFAFYLLIGFYALLLWRENRFYQDHPNKLLVLAGFLAGGAVACKYTALIYCMVPLIVGVVIQAMLRTRKWVPQPSLFLAIGKPLGIFLLAAALGCGLWFGKNAVFTGNPTYPLLYRVFGGETRTPEKELQWSQAHSAPNYQLSDLVGRLTDVTLRSDWLSPLLMPLALLAIVFRLGSTDHPAAIRHSTVTDHPEAPMADAKARGAQGTSEAPDNLTGSQSPHGVRLAYLLAGYFGFVFATWWFLTHRIDRFWVPALPLVALLAGIGATWNGSKWWRTTLGVFLVVGLVFSLLVISGGQLVDSRYLADLDELRVDPRRVDPWHLYLNKHAADVSKVLLVGDAEPFDLEVPVLYNTVFDDCIFEQLARDRTSAQVHQELTDRGISHIYVAWGEVRRYRSPGNYGITDFIQPEVFEKLVADGVLEAIEPVPSIRDNPGQLFHVWPLAKAASGQSGH